MARTPKVPPPLPVDAIVDPVVPPSTPTGPTIVFVGDGAEKVKFTVSPKAVHVTVYSNGQVVETL